MIEDLDIPVFVDYSSYESHPLEEQSGSKSMEQC